MDNSHLTFRTSRTRIKPSARLSRSILPNIHPRNKGKRKQTCCRATYHKVRGAAIDRGEPIRVLADRHAERVSPSFEKSSARPSQGRRGQGPHVGVWVIMSHDTGSIFIAPYEFS